MRAGLGHTFRMDLADDNPASNTRMWRLYIGGWVAYLLLLGVALQLDDLRAGHLNPRAIIELAWGLPNAATLALL